MSLIPLPLLKSLLGGRAGFRYRKVPIESVAPAVAVGFGRVRAQRPFLEERETEKEREREREREMQIQSVRM